MGGEETNVTQKRLINMQHPHASVSVSVLDLQSSLLAIVCSHLILTHCYLLTIRLALLVFWLLVFFLRSKNVTVPKQNDLGTWMTH